MLNDLFSPNIRNFQLSINCDQVKETYLTFLNSNTMKTNLVTLIMKVLLIGVIFAGCAPEEKHDYSDAVGLDGNSGSAGALDNNTLIFSCYVKNANTSAPISGAVVEWDQVGTWPGSIVYPRNGTTDSKGFFSVQFIFPTNQTSWNLHITRAYSPSGLYKAWTNGTTVTLKAGSPKTATIYLSPI